MRRRLWMWFNIKMDGLYKYCCLFNFQKVIYRLNKIVYVTLIYKGYTPVLFVIARDIQYYILSGKYVKRLITHLNMSYSLWIEVLEVDHFFTSCNTHIVYNSVLYSTHSLSNRVEEKETC